MARAPVKQQRTNWVALFITSGLAAGVAAFANSLDDGSKRTTERDMHVCDLAKDYLQHEPSAS